MKLDKFSELSLGKKILAIIGLNAIMIVIYNLVLFGNVNSIFTSASNELTMQSEFSILANVCVIFSKYIVFFVSFIIINILLIKNKLKAATITFAVVISLTVMFNALLASEYHQLQEGVSGFVDTYSDISTNG